MKKKYKQRTLTTFLNRYYKFQDSIVLVYRPKGTINWSDRCLFLDDSYDGRKQYNHRSILQNEVVIEFDDDDMITNKKYADIVARRLQADGFHTAKWWSGNKSTHLHFFINPMKAHNIPLLKNTIMRHYGKGLPLPDLRLCANNHLIRAEYGIHEGTGKKKKLISISGKYPKVNKISKVIWDKYIIAARTVMRRRVSTDVNKISELPGFKYILTSHEFKEAEDGRERALFLLIHTLKGQYEGRKAEFARYLIDWYKYSGGFKLTSQQIENKLNYHWKKNYTLGETFLNELLESIGCKEKIR